MSTESASARIDLLCASARARVDPQPRESMEELIRAFAEASVEAKEALRLAEEEWGVEDVRLVPILSLLAECVREVRYGIPDDKPLPFLFRAISLAEARPTRNSYQLGGLYRQTGIALDTWGDLSRSVHFLDKAVKAFEESGSSDDVSFCVGALAGTLTKLDPSLALSICRRYVELESARDPRSTCHFDALTTLGRCLLLLRDGEAAKAVITEAKQILVARAHGRPHPWVRELDEQLAEAQALIDAST